MYGQDRGACANKVEAAGCAGATVSVRQKPHKRDTKKSLCSLLVGVPQLVRFVAHLAHGISYYR